MSRKEKRTNVSFFFFVGIAGWKTNRT